MFLLMRINAVSFFIVFCAIGCIVIVAGLLLPSKFSAEASATIEAPQNVIFKQLSNAKNWEEWSVYSPKNTPGLKTFYPKPAIDENSTVMQFTSAKNGEGQLVLGEGFALEGQNYTLKLEKANLLLNGKISLQPFDSTTTKVNWQVQGQVGSNPLRRYVAIITQYALKNEMETSLVRLAAACQKNKKTFTITPP